MPLLLKKIEASIISLFGGAGDSDYTAPVQYLKNVVGEAGVEDYIKLSTFEALTQDFSAVEDGGFCDSTPTNFGLGQCTVYEELSVEYEPVVVNCEPIVPVISGGR